MQDILRKVGLTICLVIAILGLTGCQSLNGQNTAQKPLSIPTDSCLQYSPEQNEGVTPVTSDYLRSHIYLLSVLVG